jgi:rhodanese-related sulfurtransferase
MRPRSLAAIVASSEYNRGPVVLPMCAGKHRVTVSRKEYEMAATSGMTAKDMVAEAKQRVTNLTPAQVAAELASGDVLLVDLREAAEREQHGTLPHAVHAPRGMLEFYADPSSPYHDPAFAPTRRVILYCASGGRSALAADTLQQMGYTNVAHLDGGMKAWNESGLNHSAM